MVAAWRRDKTMTFFHHGYGEARPLALAFYEDSLAYSPMDAAFDQPTVIVQGLRDEAVDYRTVERFARARPNVTLHLVDDDHSLQASLPRLWTELRAVLELPS
jgi:pimeloyl-ACP methyl ester carboxylesterase